MYVENIAAALAKADPGNADAYERNREAYADELEALDSEILKLLATLPRAAGPSSPPTTRSSTSVAITG